MVTTKFTKKKRERERERDRNNKVKKESSVSRNKAGVP